MKLIEGGKNLMNSLKIVVLECPYDILSDSLSRQLFVDTIQLKLEGYGCEYPYGVLPVDTSDFVSTHHLICDLREDGLVPLMGYKTVTLQRCESHRIPFPAISVASSSGAKKHVEIVESIIERCKREKLVLAYGGAWTINPQIRKNNRPLAQVLRDLMCASMVHYYKESGFHEHMCCGSLRFKTDRFFKEMGYAPLGTDNQELPPFPQASLFGDMAMMFHATRFSESADKLAASYKDIWSQRLVIDQNWIKTRNPIRKAA